jgi:hypothetical protein
MAKGIGKESKAYLGDSVYAEWDEYNVVLTTENGLPTDPSNTIALDPEVRAALCRYINACMEG